MKTKKIIAFLLAVTMLVGISSLCAFSFTEDEIYWAEMSFRDGKGPETKGYAIDYVYFSPAVEGHDEKYPLVIWLHGMGNGSKPGAQLSASDIEAWATYEYQCRFGESKGAYIFVPRSLEEKGLFWDDSLIYPLRAALDDFIAENKDNIDTSRIYIGGYSMGGKMTLKMAVAYPEMFAAIFPICPAWVPDKAATEKIADLPVWLTSGVNDPLVNYFSMTMTVWDNIISKSNVVENCRFSTLSQTRMPGGEAAPSGHHSWFSVNYDMFALDNGDYPSMKTVDGNGDEIKLTYPNGMISWLMSFESDYDGSAATDDGNKEAYRLDSTLNVFKTIINFFKNLFKYIFNR